MLKIYISEFIREFRILKEDEEFYTGLDYLYKVVSGYEPKWYHFFYKFRYLIKI